MLSVVPEHTVGSRNHIVDAWIEDLLAAHNLHFLPSEYNQRPLLPKSCPPSAIHSTPSLSPALHLTNQRVKRKRQPYLLRDTDPNMNLTPSKPLPPSAQKPTGTKLQGSGNPLGLQLHFPPPPIATYVSGINARAASFVPPGPELQSSTKASNARSRIPVETMGDLVFADKPIRTIDLDEYTTQLPLDVSEMYERLVELGNGEGILPTLIKVNTLSGRA
jgi:hypothetical protein